MGEYKISGGVRLSGELTIGGAKNAVLPILAATVLNKGINVIRNCPKILDTSVAVKILEVLGCKVVFTGHTIIVDSSKLNSHFVPCDLMRQMRAAIIFMGSLLGAYGKATVCYPGGCDLGPRLINQHLSSLRKMGAVIADDKDCLDCYGKLEGKRIHMNLPSVGATQNVMLAAVLAKGETVITNAAKEPEIYDLQCFLSKMGANVTGAGTDTVVISGVDKLRDAEHTVIPDRIIAGTYLAAAAITGGEVLLRNVNAGHMLPITAKFEEIGCTLQHGENMLYMKAPRRLIASEVTHTLPHPGFPTDMQAQLTAILSIAKGKSTIYETVFQSRVGHINPLKSMGAEIKTVCDNSVIKIKGVEGLRGAKIAATDLRGGAALILAGLAADGETTVTESAHVERGYESIETDLTALGAKIMFSN
jgi:UDP-N-acetylglucosamine 1-carboxyvinyltransferase